MAHRLEGLHRWKARRSRRARCGRKKEEGHGPQVGAAQSPSCMPRAWLCAVLVHCDETTFQGVPLELKSSSAQELCALAACLWIRPVRGLCAACVWICPVWGTLCA